MSNIPASLAPFFKEYHLQDLDLERSAHTIIERTLRFATGMPICAKSITTYAPWSMAWPKLNSSPH